MSSSGTRVRSVWCVVFRSVCFSGHVSRLVDVEFGGTTLYISYEKSLRVAGHRECGDAVYRGALLS